MRIVAASLALVGCLVAASVVRADQLKMQCQVRQAVGAGEPLGAYTFLFDPASESLSVRLQPMYDQRLMFGWDVKQWKLLFLLGRRFDVATHGLATSGFRISGWYSAAGAAPLVFTLNNGA